MTTKKPDNSPGGEKREETKQNKRDNSYNKSSKSVQKRKIIN